MPVGSVRGEPRQKIPGLVHPGPAPSQARTVLTSCIVCGPRTYTDSLDRVQHLALKLEEKKSPQDFVFTT